MFSGVPTRGRQNPITQRNKTYRDHQKWFWTTRSKSKKIQKKSKNRYKTMFLSILYMVFTTQEPCVWKKKPPTRKRLEGQAPGSGCWTCATTRWRRLGRRPGAVLLLKNEILLVFKGRDFRWLCFLFKQSRTTQALNLLFDTFVILKCLITDAVFLFLSQLNN